MTRLRLFTVTIDGLGSVMVNARSRSAAIAEAFRSDAFSGYTFKDFLTKLKPRAHTCRTGPASDGYDYVRRVYGVDPRIGQRVRLVNENKSTGREGTVLYPGPSTAHVVVQLDGDRHSVHVHPQNVVLL